MKIVIINGSARKGNTLTAINAFIKAGTSVPGDDHPVLQGPGSPERRETS